MGEPGPRRILCDEMLAGLARWLRAAGHDATTPVKGEPDTLLVARAAVQDRLFLTRDRPILQHRNAAGFAVLLETQSLDDQAAELRNRLALDWLHAPFSRCLVCNVPVEPARPVDLARIPDQAQALPGPIHRCPSCERVYWPGSHERRMRKRLVEWAGVGPPAAG